MSVERLIPPVLIILIIAILWWKGQPMKASDGRQSWSLTLLISMYVLCAGVTLGYFYVDYKAAKFNAQQIAAKGTLPAAAPPATNPASRRRRRSRVKARTSSPRAYQGVQISDRGRELIFTMLGAMLLLAAINYLLSHGEGRFMVNIVAAWKGNNPYQGQDPVRAAIADVLADSIDNESARDLLLILEHKNSQGVGYAEPRTSYPPVMEDDE